MEEQRKRIGILTGGGDCPGLNAVIRAACTTAERFGYQVVGLYDGFEGESLPVIAVLLVLT